MSDIGEDLGKAAITAALGIATNVVTNAITKRQLAQQALDLAASTGVALADLVGYLQAADAARAEMALRLAQQVSYGQSEG